MGYWICDLRFYSIYCLMLWNGFGVWMLGVNLCVVFWGIGSVLGSFIFCSVMVLGLWSFRFFFWKELRNIKSFYFFMLSVNLLFVYLFIFIDI